MPSPTAHLSGRTCMAHTVVAASALPGIMGGGTSCCSRSAAPLARSTAPGPPAAFTLRAAVRSTCAVSSASAWWPWSAAGWTRKSTAWEGEDTHLSRPPASPGSMHALALPPSKAAQNSLLLACRVRGIVVKVFVLPPLLRLCQRVARQRGQAALEHGAVLQAEQAGERGGARLGAARVQVRRHVSTITCCTAENLNHCQA